MMERPENVKKTYSNEEIIASNLESRLSEVASYAVSQEQSPTMLQVNMGYEYEDSDINTILEVKVRDISSVIGVINYVLGAIDNVVPDQLQRSMQTCIEELRKKPPTNYNLLIPFNLGCYHWVGLVVHLDANFQATKIIYCDSLRRIIQVPEPISTAVNKLWRGMQITVVELLTQLDMKSCGVLAIVNLINLVQGITDRRALLTSDVEALRRNDLLLVKAKRLDYFESFYQRQLNNRPSVAAIPQQVAMLSQEIKFSPQEYKRIVQGYELIKCIRDNNLRNLLQECLRNKEEFNDNVHLYLQQIREGFNRVLRQHIAREDREDINRLITLFFGFELGEVPLTDVGDSKFRVEHEELRAIGKLSRGKDIDSLKEFTHALDAQINADEVYARKLQEEYNSFYVFLPIEQKKDELLQSKKETLDKDKINGISSQVASQNTNTATRNNPSSQENHAAPILHAGNNMTVGDVNIRKIINAGTIINVHHSNKAHDQLLSHSSDDVISKSDIQMFWNVPPENKYFVGRNKLLTTIEAELNKTPTDKKIQPLVLCACAGMPGIGKTQLTLRYVYQSYYELRYKNIFWFHAENELQLGKDCLNLCEKLGMKKNNMKMVDAIEVIKEWLQSDQLSEWLAVYDNADNSQMIEKYLPRVGRGKILITSRLTVLGQISNSPIIVDVFSFEDAYKYVVDVVFDGKVEAAAAQRNDIEKIIGPTYLCYFPLALAQACFYIKESDDLKLIRQFLEKYDQHRYNLLKRKPESVPHEAVITTWELATQFIYTKMPDSIKLLKFCAFLHPDNISHDILNAFLISQGINDVLKQDDIRKTLSNYSMVQINTDKDGISIHRLLQQTIKDDMQTKNGSGSFIAMIADLLNKLLARNMKTPFAILHLLSHVEVFLTEIKKYSPSHEGILYNFWRKVDAWWPRNSGYWLYLSANADFWYNVICLTTNYVQMLILTSDYDRAISWLNWIKSHALEFYEDKFTTARAEVFYLLGVVNSLTGNGRNDTHLRNAYLLIKSLESNDVSVKYLKVRIYIRYSKMLLQKNCNEESSELLNEISTLIGNGEKLPPVDLVDYYRSLVKYYRVKNKLKTCHFYLNIAAKIIKENSIQYAEEYRLYLEMAIICLQRNELAPAETFLNKAYNYSKDLFKGNNNVVYLEFEMYFGILYSKKNDYSTALAHFTNMVKRAEQNYDYLGFTTLVIAFVQKWSEMRHPSKGSTDIEKISHCFWWIFNIHKILYGEYHANTIFLGQCMEEFNAKAKISDDDNTPKFR